MNAEGAAGDLRPPRGVRGGDPCRPGGARLRAVRRPAPCLADRDRRAWSRTASTGRRSTARSSAAASCWPAARASSTGKIFRLGHLGSVTVEEILGAIEHARVRRRSRPGRPVRAGCRPSRPPRSRPLESLGLDARRPGPAREGPGRRGGRARRASSCLAADHDVDERLGLHARRSCAAILPDYDALIVRSQVQVDAELIAAGTRLVVIGRAGVGVDNVDLEAATRAGITVVNAPTGNTIAAAEHTLALLYGVARRTAAGRCLDAPRRVEAAAVHRPRAARSDAGHRRPGQDRSGHRGARPGDGDDRDRGRSVRDRGAGREPRRRAGRRSTNCSPAPTSSPSTCR